jgi:hypothetical protein
MWTDPSNLCIIWRGVKPGRIGSWLGFARQHDMPLVSDTSWSLDAVQNTLTQEGKTCFAIHHALDQLDSGHLPFDLTVIDGQG